MKFTYEANLLCLGNAFNTENCARFASGEPAENEEAARANAMEEARRRGWGQLGDEMWCPWCASLRQQGEEIRKSRGGRFCPVTGMRLRYAFPKAGAIGHQMTAALSLREGAVYTVSKVLPNSFGVMVLFTEVPTLFFNCELFEEVKA